MVCITCSREIDNVPAIINRHCLKCLAVRIQQDRQICFIQLRRDTITKWNARKKLKKSSFSFSST